MYRIPYAEHVKTYTRNAHVCLLQCTGGKFESIHVLMSAEPARKKAYSIDLQWRVVYQRIGMALPFYKIAKNLNIATSTAHHIYNKFANSGDVQSMERRCRPELRSLDEHSELVILGLILESPTLYLNEVVREVSELTCHSFSCNHLQDIQALWFHQKEQSDK